ncbi:MAG: Na+/H+ antiporter NhaC family protein [Balneolaceae bacterium]
MPIFLFAGGASLYASGGEMAVPSVRFGTWWSLLPPLVAIGLALLTREVILSLFSGVWIGAWILAGFDPFAGTAHSLSLLLDAMANRDHAAIILFSLLLGGMVGIMSRSGGTLGVVERLSRFAQDRFRGQLMIWLSSFAVFFDDYANTLIRGNALRPMSDRLLISREKLAYIIDSTAAPLAVSAVITTWIGFEITQIRNAFETMAASASSPEHAAQLQAGADSAFMIFLHSVPYLFYPILALLFVLMVILTNRDFGPMLQAERRAVSGGGVLRPGSVPAADTSVRSLQPKPGVPARWPNAALPILTVILVAAVGLYRTGIEGLPPDERSLAMIIGGADPFRALLWASFSGCLVALLLPVQQRILTTGEALEALLGGMQSMLIAMAILILAWGLGSVTELAGTGPYLTSLLQETLPLTLLPGLVFLIASLIAFATGTSWGTMAILFPIVIPLAVNMGAGVGPVDGQMYAILLGSISSVMGGAVFGDHCSPISDTTVLSSMSSACDLIDHVRTQLPYALLIAFVALLVGELPAAFNWIHPLAGMGAGLVLLYLFLRFFGENPEDS